MRTKFAIASVLLCLIGAAHADNFYIATPSMAGSSSGAGQKPPEPSIPIEVSLSSSVLPKAYANQAYSESLAGYLRVTGDSNFDASAVSWSLSDSVVLPAGLNLSDGVISGTPTALSPSTDYSVVAAYKNASGQAQYTLEVGGKLMAVTQISIGQDHACALTPEGGVKCWGSQSDGALGNNVVSSTPALSPVDAVGLTSGVRAVYAGFNRTCAIMVAGNQLKCWGANNFGELGIGTSGVGSGKAIPTDVKNIPEGALSLALAGNTSCAVTTSRQVKCWGDGKSGQVGNGSASNVSSPVLVSSLVDDFGRLLPIENVFGFSAVCAVTTGGELFCWGYGYTNTPAKISGISSVVMGGEGDGHTCVLTSAGQVLCKGKGAYGQQGQGTVYDTYEFTVVPGLVNVTSLSVGKYHNCAIQADKAVKCWGANFSGQLGVGPKVNQTSPTSVALDGQVSQISAGSFSTCMHLTDGTARCAGLNQKGQLGNKTTNPDSTFFDGVLE